MDPATRQRTTTSPIVLAAVLLGSALFVYLQTFILPNIPRISGGDQGIYLSLGARIVDGQVPYRDYDHFSLPATDLLYALLFKLFGVRAWIAPLCLILLGTSLVWISVKICEKIMNGPIVFLPGLLFLTLPFSSYLDATHHWYSTLAVTAAILITIEERTNGRLLWSGFLWGLATCFTQTAAVGALGIVIFLFWERAHAGQSARWLLQRLALFGLSLVGTVALFNAYFMWKAGPSRFFYDTLIFLFKDYNADRFNSWAAYGTGPPPLRFPSRWPEVVAFLLIHLIVPLAYILVLVRNWRESKKYASEPWDRLILLSLTGFCLFLGVVNSAAWPRMYTVSLLALVLTAWLLKAPFRPERVLLAALWTAVIIMAVARPAITQTLWNGSLVLPTGRTAFPGSPAAYEKCKWLSQRTQPGDYLLNDPHVCFALRLRDPSRVPFLRPTAYTTREQSEGAIVGLSAHHVKFVNWYGGMDNEMNPTDHLGPLRAYLRSHYHIAQTFSNGDEIWELNDFGN